MKEVPALMNSTCARCFERRTEIIEDVRQDTNHKIRRRAAPTAWCMKTLAWMRASCLHADESYK